MNMLEVEMVVAIVGNLKKRFLLFLEGEEGVEEGGQQGRRSLTVGVISPYAAQVEAICADLGTRPSRKRRGPAARDESEGGLAVGGGGGEGVGEAAGVEINAICEGQFVVEVCAVVSDSYALTR